MDQLRLVSSEENRRFHPPVMQVTSLRLLPLSLRHDLSQERATAGRRNSTKLHAMWAQECATQKGDCTKQVTVKG